MSKKKAKNKTLVLTWHQNRKLAVRKKILLSLSEMYRKGANINLESLARKSQSAVMSIRRHLLAAGHLRKRNGISIIVIDELQLNRQAEAIRRGESVLSDEDLRQCVIYRGIYQGSLWETVNQATRSEAESRILASAFELVHNNKPVNYRSIGAHCCASKQTVAAVMKRHGHSVRRGTRDMLKIDLNLLSEQVKAINNALDASLRREAS